MTALSVSAMDAGPALDWAVGAAMGWCLKKTNSMMGPQDGWGRSLPGDPFEVADPWPVWHDQSGSPAKWPRLYKIKSRDWTPSSDGEFLGKLIILFDLDISQNGNEWRVFADKKSHLAQQDQSLLVSACRAIAASRLGCVIDVPEDVGA